MTKAELKVIPDKVPVTERALIERLNRKLAKKQFSQRLHKTRGKHQKQMGQMGEYYIIEEHTNTIKDYRLGRERLVYIAREEGALAPWEELAP
jgi:hypothetical protein